MTTMHTTLMRGATALSLLFLSACSTLPTYRAPSGQPLATVKVMGLGESRVCVDGKWHAPDLSDLDGVRAFNVAANQRITMGTFMSYQGYNVISTCRPAISVIPRASTTLILNSGLDGNRCFIEAVRENNDVDTGVSLETSLGAPQC